LWQDDPVLPLFSSEQILAKLAERALPGAVLASDADGTIWSGDIGIDTFERMLERRAFRAEAGAALAREGAAHGIETPSDPTEAARALYRAFEKGDYPERDAFQMMAWAFAGYRVDEVRAFGRDVVDAVGLASRLHPEALPILHWAKAKGVPLYVVSASCEIVVRAALEKLALPVTDVFGMSPAVENGVVVAGVNEPVTYGPGKVEALRRGTRGGRLIGAFGDSAYDLAMLAEAGVGVAVRPKPELRARAATCPGLVELAPSVP
jgi:HAD superfamily phosphoserine phosphatase-like hydrolase